jgi:hypothetical protein
MQLNRRALVKAFLGLASSSFLPFRASAEARDLKHILCACSDTKMAVCLSTDRPARSLTLSVGDRRQEGVRADSAGFHWQFLLEDLSPGTQYSLQVWEGDLPWGTSWLLKTFPAPGEAVSTFRLLTYTCAGGGDGFGLPGRQFFKPHAFRQTLFEAALAQQPDAAVAIGDHVYWDLRGEDIPQVGRRNRLVKFMVGGYLRIRYGAFDRDQDLIGTPNEEVLRRIGNEQIADLYGTRFRSVPMFFVADDHDYFENDDAEPDLVTFPADAFSRAAHRAMADLYYPPLLDTPSGKPDRSFGSIRYGDLFEAPLLDCAGQMTLGGDQAGLIPPEIEGWARERMAVSQAKVFALVPSHPPGYTAGKWREWYPDVVARAGNTGVVTNPLLGELEGQLSVEAEKFLWQRGWWLQHQRLLASLAQRSGLRFVLSGDIHAQGAVAIERSGENDFSSDPLVSVLVGPVSTSTGSWPSAARGVSAATPHWLEVETLAPMTESNGFAIAEISPGKAAIRLFDCGGHDPDLGESGIPLRGRVLNLLSPGMI